MCLIREQGTGNRWNFARPHEPVTFHFPELYVVHIWGEGHCSIFTPTINSIVLKLLCIMRLVLYLSLNSSTDSADELISVEAKNLTL